MALFKCVDCGFRSKTTDKNLDKLAVCPKCGSRHRVTNEGELAAVPTPTSTAMEIGQEISGDELQPLLPSPPPLPAIADSVPTITRLPLWALVFTAVAFTLCALAVCAGGILFIMSLTESESAVQQGAAGAVFAAGFVGVYVLARCVEKVVSIVVIASRS